MIMPQPNYEALVKTVYPDAYMAYNSLFETFCLYENHRCEHRISERLKAPYLCWENAYETLIKQNKIKPQ